MPAFKTRQNYPNSPLQLPGATQAAADLSCSSHKCLRPWQCLFMDVQGCRLPAFKTPQTLPCSSQAPLRPRQTFPAAPTSPRPFVRRSRVPFASLQNSPNPPLQLPGATQAAADLSCSSNKSLKPWQCPFKEVQGSRSPAFKTRQNSPNPPLQLPGATQAAADLSCSSNKSLRPWQCPFMEVQGCLLPAFETRLTPQTLPCSSQAPLRPRQTFPAALTRFKVPEAVAASFYGRSRLPFASPQNSPNPPLQLPGATQAAADLSCSSNKSLRPWQCPFKEVQGWFASLQNSPKLPKPSPAAPRRHSGRGRPFLQLQQVSEGVAVSFYGRSRLPFASLQNSPNPPLQLPGATQAAADLSCSSNKSLRPWQCLFMDVQGCRLPAFKTPQTLPCSSQAPLRPRQTFPAAPTSP